MKKRKLFSRDPLIWFHYILLVGILFGAYYLGEVLININSTKWYVMFIWFFAFISIGDQLIHYILKVD